MTGRVRNDTSHTLLKERRYERPYAFRGVTIALPVLQNAITDFRFIIGLWKSPKCSNEDWINTRKNYVAVPTAGFWVLCILPLDDGKYVGIPIYGGPRRRNAHTKERAKLLRLSGFRIQMFRGDRNEAQPRRKKIRGMQGDLHAVCFWGTILPVTATSHGKQVQISGWR